MLHSVLATASRDRCADRLIELALAAGRHDNVSVIVADVVSATRPDASWPRE